MDIIEARAHLSDVEDIKNDRESLCARHVEVIGHEPEADESCAEIAQTLREYLDELISAEVAANGRRMQPLPKNLTQSMPAEVDLLIWGPTIGHQVVQWWQAEHASADSGEGFYLTWDHSFIDPEKVTHFTVLDTAA